MGAGLLIPGFWSLNSSQGLGSLGARLGPVRKVAPTGLTRPLVPGCLVKAVVSGGVVYGDAATAADTTNGSGVLLLGRMGIMYDAKGNALDYDYLPAGATAGAFQCYESADDVFTGLENGTMSASGVATGSAALAEVAPSDFDASIYGTGNPEATARDLVNSSTLNASATYHALQILGAVVGADNDGGPDVSAKRFSYRLKIASTFKYPS